MMEPTPVYICTGFLDSGKTLLVKDTLMEQEWIEPGLTLLILCEEGEEEYSKEYLEENDMVLLKIDKFEQLNAAFFTNCEKNYHPAQVVIEYNGMWLVSDFEKMQLPQGWGVEQQITCVDASTFQMYMANMKSIFMDMVRNADMVVFNRSKKEYPLANFRRSIKVVNPSAEVIFEDEEGEMTDIFADQMPFDLDAEIVDIPPEDYGIWFVDAMDHPDRYVGKTLRFKARARRPRGMGSKFFIPGRTAMTCCADDTSFLGYICKSAYAPKLKPGEWVEVTAKVAFENRSEYQGEGIVLYAENVTPCEPLADEMVYFN